MKPLRVLPVLVSALLIVFQNATAQVFTVKSSNLVVAGTSSLHDWQSAAEVIDMKGGYTLENETLADIRGVVVKVPVKEIKSSKGKMMDSKTWDAFNYEKNPFIVFTLATWTINPQQNTLHVTGTLAMAGVTRPIDLSLSYKVLRGGDLLITGSRKLKMSDFKMEPPTAMMGTIKVGDEVEVRFEATLSMAGATL